MKRMTAVALVVLVLVGMALAGCAVELIEAPMEEESAATAPGYATQTELRYLDRVFLDGSMEQPGMAMAPDLAMNPELRFLDRAFIDGSMEQAGMAMAPDLATNPELRFLDRVYMAGFVSDEIVLDAGAMPALFFVTTPEHLAGTWSCAMTGCEQRILMELDGTISRVLGPNDTVEIGYFWFSDGAFHVVGEFDDTAAESAFHVFAETEGDVTFLRLKQCGGNCADAAGIEWLQGLNRIEPAG
jgi:hypothetical protein